MNHKWMIILAATAALAVGCNDDIDPSGSGSPVMNFLFADNVGTSRSLPDTGFDEAYQAARAVMSQRYTIAEADPDSGLIRGETVFLGATRDRILGSSPGRRVPMVKIRRRGGRVEAVASVAIQRQGSAMFRQYEPYEENYDSIPNKTPAAADAATTPDQNDVWETQSYDHTAENEILNDIERALQRANDD